MLFFFKSSVLFGQEFVHYDLAYAGILMLLEGETPLFVMLDMPKPPPAVCISEYEILTKLWAAPLWPSFVRRTG
jgi:hypothetical protein